MNTRLPSRSLNTNGRAFDVSQCQAMGFTGFRHDLPFKALSHAKEVTAHYSPLPSIWIVRQDYGAHAVDAARMLAQFGALEIGNEPNIANFNPDSVAWTPKHYASFFKTIRKACPHAFLIGPACSVWDPVYIKECIDAGCNFDAVSFHPYGLVPSDAKVAWQKARTLFGRPVWLSEYSGDPTQDPSGFIRSACSELAGVPWTYYPAASSPPDPRSLWTDAGATALQGAFAALTT